MSKPDRDSEKMRVESQAASAELRNWVRGCELRRLALHVGTHAQTVRQAAVVDGNARAVGESLSAYVERILGSHGKGSAR
jgi:hypothetical protein